jgi:ACS family D-galactonate transporter-like MFS transporter
MVATHARHLMLGLIMCATAVNYLDRTNFGVAAPYITHDLGLSPVMLGVLFSAFSWTYTPMQLPGGYFLDRLGPRLVYGVALLGWSVFTLCIGYSTTFTLLIICRLLVGFFEAPAFPANGRVVTAWFPTHERGRATSYFEAAQYIGMGFCAPFITWLIAAYSWHAAFLTCGVIGLVVTVAWFAIYRDPRYCRRANQAELDLIARGGGVANVEERNRVTWGNFLQLFKYRQLWGMYIGKFAVGTTNNFFTTWFFTYLVMEKHFTFLKTGIYANIPFWGAFAGVLLVGRISDWMLRHGFSLGMSRNVPTVVGLVLSCSVMAAAYIDNAAFVITVLTIAYLGQAAAGGIAFALLSDIAPRELVGLSNGMLNFAATLGGMSCPLIVGFIVQYTGSFVLALIYIGAVSLVAALAYLLMVSRPYRIVLGE